MWFMKPALAERDRKEINARRNREVTKVDDSACSAFAGKRRRLCFGTPSDAVEPASDGIESAQKSRIPGGLLWQYQPVANIDGLILSWQMKTQDSHQSIGRQIDTNLLPIVG